MPEDNNIGVDGNIGVDKDAPWGEFVKGQRWRQNLARRATHKALDLADDEMNFHQHVSRGLGWKELLVLGALLLGGAGLGLSALDHLTPPPQPPAVSAPADTEYEVRFYDSQGNPIRVPRLPQPPE